MMIMLMEAFSAVGTVGATAPIAAQHVAGTAQMITSAIKSIGTNPFFYTSMLQTVGQEYYDALDSGATETEAFIASTLSSLLQSVVEVGGTTGNAGLQSLPDALKAAKGKGAGKVALEWVKSSFSEGKEEVVQSVLSKLTAAAVYDQNRKIFSLEDEDAIINPKLLAQEFGMGTAVAAIAGGGQVTFQQILQHADAKQLQSLGKAVLQDGDVAGLANYAKDSMNPEIRAIAVGADSGKVSAADAGTLYKYVYQDISAQLDGAQSYEAVSETYKDILRKNPDPAVAQIASSLYIEKTMDALQIAEEEAMQQVQGVEQSVLPQAVDNAVQSGYTDGTGGGQNGGEELLYNRGGQAGEQNADTQGRVGAVQEAAGGMESDLSTRGVETGVLGDRGDSGRVTVSAEQIERLKTTAVKNADGTPKPVYHFTGNMEFDTFAEGDTGFHFGSEAQAAQRGQDLNQSGRMIEAYLDIQNPVRIDMDIMNWQPGALALKLYGDGIISENEMYNIGRLVQESGVGYNSPAAVELRRILAEKGYDGVVYQNGFEGEGESYIAFYPEQIITLDDGRGGTGNAVRTARRSGGADIVSEERVGQARGDTQYTEAQYNDFGWARANGVLSDTAFRLLTEKIAEIKTGTQFARTRYGDYIIPVGDESGIYNILVYTDGNMESPHIRKIIEINVEDRQKLNEIRSYIYAAEKSNEAGGYRNAYEYAKRVYGEENIVAYTRQDYPAFRQYAGEGQRGAGRAGDRADGTGIDRGTDATGAGAGRQVNRRTQADSDGSAFSMQNDTAQERTQRDQYAKEDRFWQAENRNAPEVSNDKATAKIQRAIRGLFGGGNNREADSIGDIVDMIRDTFGVPISTGKFRQRAFGIYKRRAEAIRTKVTNALPTIAHELGHHLDKRYGLHRLRSMSEALRVLRESRPEFYNSYSESERPGEAVAEFVRDYLTDRLMAKEKYPTFFADFERTLSENGPEDFKNLKKIGDEINRYFAMGKKERARAAVLTYAEYGRKKKKNLGFEQMSDAVQRHFFDSAYALKKLSPEAYRRFYYAVKSSVRAVNALEGEYVAGLDGNPMKAYDADGNVRTDKDGNALLLPSFRNVLAPIEAGEMYNDFNLYLVCRHGLSWLETGKRVFADDSINNEKFMRDTVKELEAQYPEFKKTANDVNDWWQSVLWEYGVKSGLMTKQQVQDLHQKYPHYVPLMRAVDTQGKGMKRGVANQRAPIVRAKGSGTEIVDPVANIGIKLEQLMRAADRNAVMQSLAGLADTQDGFGALMEEVPPDLVPVTVRTAAIRDDLKNMGQEMGFSALDPQGFSDFIDQVIGDTITEFKTVIGGKDRNVIWVYENGKRRLYQVHDAGLLEAITDLNVTRDPAFLRAIGNVTRKFKALTTGGNPVWSLASNAPRDFSSGYVYGSERNVFKYTRDYIKAVLHVLKRSKELQLYKTAGGGYNNSLTMSDKQVLSTMRRILMRDGSAKERIKNFFNLAEKIEKISDAVETAPRLAEFERVLRRTGDTHAALYAADEATVNFNRGGITAKQLDKFTPYLNASLQGLNKFLQHAGTNKNDFWLKFTVVEIVKTGIALGLGYFFANSLDDLFDEYDKLSAYKRNNFYNIYMGDGKFFSIPKAKDTAVFGTMVDNIARLWRQGKDADIKQETRDFADYMWLCFGPPIVLKDSIIVSTYAELAANKDFKGTPIVPEYYIDNYVDEEQYNERTTWIAKAIGQITGLSPMRIDYIINSNFGYLGTINKALGIDDKDWTLGIKSKYVTDNAYSTDIINRFYDHADDYEKKAKSYPDNAEYVYKYKQYNAVKSIVSDLNAYGRDDPDMARQCKILARDYVDDFEKNGTVNKQLLALLEDSGDSEILFDKSFSRTYSRNKVEYTMDIQDYLDYVDTYYEEVEMEYEDILSMGLSDEATIRMLKDAKKTITKRLDQQYKTVK